MTETKNQDIIKAVAEGKSYTDGKNFLFRVHNEKTGHYDGFGTRWEAVQHSVKLTKNGSGVSPAIYKHESISNQYVKDSTGHAQLAEKLKGKVTSGTDNSSAIQHWKELGTLANEIAKTLRATDQSGLERLRMDFEAKYMKARSVFSHDPATDTVTGSTAPKPAAGMHAEIVKK